MNSSIDMFDLPTESELGEVILEASKKAKKEGGFDEETMFPFWKPQGGPHAIQVSNKSGVVKPKVDFVASETSIDAAWEKFLGSDKAKAKSAKPATKVDNFGSVVLDSFAQKPSTDKLVGSIKALKKTTVKEMSGKVTHKVEELGVGKVIEDSNADKPKKDNSGAVKPKADLGKQKMPKIFDEKPEMVDVSGTVTMLDSYDAKLKSTPNDVTVSSKADKPKKDNSDAVKPKADLGKQRVPAKEMGK
jgi:hypothetical protein